MHRDRFQTQEKTAVAEKVLGKSLPFNHEAERAVLSSIILSDQTLAAVSDFLRPIDFYYPAHRVIYKALLDIAASQRRVDFLTLQDELERTGQLEVAGGIVGIISLQDEIPSVGLIEQHARIIKNKAVLRELISSATTIITNCYAQNEKEIESVLDEAEKTIFQISNKRTSQSFVQLNIWLKKTFQHLADMKGLSRGVTGVASGFKKLDEMTSGFQNSDLIILAARPSMGKTAFALALAQQAALEGHTVGFFSLEMSAEQLTLRLLSSQAGVPHHLVRNAMLNHVQWTSLTNVAGILAEIKLFIDDMPMQTVMDIRAKARKLKIEHNLSFLVVDYLQLLNSSKRHENRHQEVSEISRSLKALAKELGIPIIALSQLSRAVDSRPDKRPMLSDLRESGAIEQDADIIMFLYRDLVYNQETEDPDKAEVIIGKQRNGPTGTVDLTFVRELTRFEDR